MKQRKPAGHLLSVSLSNMFQDCLVACGFLTKDVRGEHAVDGSPRNYSGHDIRTSYIERMEYVESTDTTIVFTRNSEYYVPGNILLEQLGFDGRYAEGAKDLRDMWDEEHSEAEGDYNV